MAPRLPSLDPAMKKNCPLLFFLCLPMIFAASAPQSPVSPQAPAVTEFPAELLKGSENFNLAIDIYGDLRGNFGPCG
jgi:hypothetical protein